jgi:hypothetical protein
MLVTATAPDPTLGAGGFSTFPDYATLRPILLAAL